MNIGKVSDFTGLSIKQIRDYEKIGLIAPCSRTDAGYRLYDEKVLNRLQFIAHARNVGFSLAQIQNLLDMQESAEVSSCEVKALTAKHIDELDQKINQLQAMRSTLQAWHDKCQGETGADCPILQSLHRA